MLDGVRHRLFGDVVEMPRRHVVPEGDRLGAIEAARDASQRLRLGREFVEGRHQPVGVHIDREQSLQDHAEMVEGLADPVGDFGRDSAFGWGLLGHLIRQALGQQAQAR